MKYQQVAFKPRQSKVTDLSISSVVKIFHKLSYLKEKQQILLRFDIFAWKRLKQ